MGEEVWAILAVEIQIMHWSSANVARVNNANSSNAAGVLRK